MSEYKYAILCEDDTHRTFVKHILPVLAKPTLPDIVVVEDENFPVMAHNDDQVERKCFDACRLAFVKYNVDIFVVCRDTDSVEVKKYHEIETRLKKKLPQRWIDRTIIVLPVQCIEHWLLFLKQRIDNQSTRKNDPIESIPRNEAKVIMYGKLHTKEHRSNIVQSHCSNEDISLLQDRSPSFQKFATNVRTVLEHLTGRTSA